MVGAVPRDDDRQLGEQHRQLVLVVGALVAPIVEIMQDVPAVVALDQRKVLEGSRGVIPHEAEIHPLPVVHRADLDCGLALAV